MICPYCNSSSVIKKGLNSQKTKQNYQCKDCKRKFVCNGQDWFVSDYEKTVIDNLLKERISLRGICRVVSVSLRWLVLYSRKLYEAQPIDLGYKHQTLKVKEKGVLYLKLHDCESDEMWSFVKEKKNKQWIWIALCAQTKQVIWFHVGGRGRKDAQLFWDGIPQIVKDQCVFHTDDWEAYKGVIPESIHLSAKQKKYTNHIERFNCTVRQRVARLVRLSLSFSKKLEYHILALRYFFCAHNREVKLKLGLDV